MTIQDFQNKHSYHKITAEVFDFRLFWKLSKNIRFHRNKCKLQIAYGYVAQSCHPFFEKKSHLFIRYAQFFHFMLFLLSKIVLFCVEKLKHKGVFMKIEIIHVWHILSSLAQKRNSVDFSNPSCKLAMLSKVSYQ